MNSPEDLQAKIGEHMERDAMIGMIVKEFVVFALAKDWDGIERLGLHISVAAKMTKAKFKDDAQGGSK